MLVWNDLEPDEKIKVYDKGVDITDGQGVYDLLVSYRSGDVWAPKVDATEALKLELAYFLDCIRRNETPSNDGAAGLRVVRLLEAADQSLKDRGQTRRSSNCQRSTCCQMLPDNPLVDYFRCPESLARAGTDGRPVVAAMAISRSAMPCATGGWPAGRPRHHVSDSSSTPSTRGRTDHSDRLRLPFDLSEVVTNLRQERYQPERLSLPRRAHHRAGRTARLLPLRPMLPVGVRKHLQKIRLSGWERIAFPRWPVDASVDALMRAGSWTADQAARRQIASRSSGSGRRAQMRA